MTSSKNVHPTTLLQYTISDEQFPHFFHLSDFTRNDLKELKKSKGYNKGKDFVENWLNSRYPGQNSKPKFELTYEKRHTYSTSHNNPYNNAYNNSYRYQRNDRSWSSTTTTFASVITIYNIEEIFPILNVLNITRIRVFLAKQPPPGLMWAKCKRIPTNSTYDKTGCNCDSSHMITIPKPVPWNGTCGCLPQPA